MYESRAYDTEGGDPVVVLVTTGTHDVSRLVQLFKGRGALVEQLMVGDTILRQLKRHNRGRAAVELLKAHGGSDFTDEQSPVEPAALGPWLRKLPLRTILADRDGNPCLRETGEEHRHRAANRDFPALFILGDPFELTEGHDQIADLAKWYAPFTVLRLGKEEDAADG